jgi:hypothetical protein
MYLAFIQAIKGAPLQNFAIYVKAAPPFFFYYCIEGSIGCLRVPVMLIKSGIWVAVGLSYVKYLVASV